MKDFLHGMATSAAVIAFALANVIVFKGEWGILSVAGCFIILGASAILSYLSSIWRS